jgi:peptidoglycan/xylan/chitin deacetylase (PgdA/CDA1 family)
MRRMSITLAAVAAVITMLRAAAGPAAQTGVVHFVGKTKYLNNARAVVVHTIDDSTKLVVDTADAMDKYDIKGTFFISTEQDPPPEERFFNQLQVWLLWPRMQKAVENGHEVGAHAVTHPCSRPQSDTTSDTYKAFCEANYNDAELLASRDTILKRTTQPYVWTWAYPCGHCANLEVIQKRIAAAGYIVARNYPGEALGLHIRPDLQTWASNPYDAPYTQVVQKQGGRRGAEAPPIDVPSLDAKFDEVYEKGGIYHFMSHPQSLDFGPDGFYEKHLSHISRRPDIWYVPMGPVYAFKTIVDRTDVRPLSNGGAKARFAVSNTLDRKIYSGSLTLEFTAPPTISVLSGGAKLAERGKTVTDRWNEEYVRREGDRLFVTVRSNTTLEFR